MPISDTTNALIKALGNDVVQTGDRISTRHCTDWSGENPARPSALIRPRNTDELSRALAICHAARQGVVPQGGMTGMCGAAVPSGQDVAISLERMCEIEEIDAASATMTVQAGTTLEAAQEAARQAGFELGLDLGARGTCQIGGNLATNAGGNRVIQSGSARDQILGMEVVLANGTVLRSLNKMIKNNTGYDLKHLFIGSEGTLGIITRAVLKLHPPRPVRRTALVALDTYGAAITLLRKLIARFGQSVSAFEVMWDDFFKLGVELGKVPAPFNATYPLYALVEISDHTSTANHDVLNEILAEAFESGILRDAVIAQSLDDTHGLWKVRECTAEFPVHLDPINFDVSVPIGNIGKLVENCRRELDTRWPGNRSYFFGHIGDSNLHLTVDGKSLPNVVHIEVYDVVYGIVAQMQGSVSAEHGIGILKREYLPLSRTPEELATMRALKAALDPHGIMNPGKLF